MFRSSAHGVPGHQPWLFCRRWRGEDPWPWAQTLWTPGPAANHPCAFEKLLIVFVSLSPHL